MADLVNAYGNTVYPIPPGDSQVKPGLLNPMQPSAPTADVTPSIVPGMPALIIPKPFRLSEQSDDALGKIKKEIMDKVSMCESAMTRFYLEYAEFAQSYRVQPRDPLYGKPRGFSNSKSGETHRATETLATLWFRELTASDKFYEAVSEGLDNYGQPVTEQALYAVESLLWKQLTKFKFKQELMTALTSCALFGTVIFEEPWERIMNLDGKTYFEGTGFRLRPLISTGFDTTAIDLDFSDYIYTVDYPTVWRLKAWTRQDNDLWDKDKIMEELNDLTYAKNETGVKTSTNVLNRIMERKQRAGYNFIDKNIKELITYHGKIDTDNEVVKRYWESLGRQDDPSNYDFTVGILNGKPIIRFHITQYGSWHSKFKYAHFKRLELEPLGYGTGKLGQRAQRDIDINQSRVNDTALMGLYSMWLVGRYSGVKPNQLNIKPWGIVEADDISQVQKLMPDYNAVTMGNTIINILREELRATTGASTNLQAINSGASATESSITQNEAIRAASVHAELIAETMIREHLEQMHINNLDFLDEAIWVNITGEQKPRGLTRHDLPTSVGFTIKVTTDKDFRPDRQQKILEGLKIVTSIRNILPSSINAVIPLVEEYFRGLGMNPRKLYENKMSIQDQMTDQMRRQQQMQQFPHLANEVEGQELGAMSAQNNGISTPMGPVPTSPMGSQLIQAA